MADRLPFAMLDAALGLTNVLTIDALATSLTALKPNKFLDLDWSIVNKQGMTRPDHVGTHGAQDVQKATHGVFYGDPVDVTNNAWAIGQRLKIKPVFANDADFYIIPRPNSGYAGGFAGQGQNYNTVTIVTQPGTNKLITGYPGNGLPLPRPPKP